MNPLKRTAVRWAY